ncbi:LIC12162 family protein [Pelosinus sp. sgz500959]|uniref:LIC12162 family transferase n=1 Tax=Pelosinus sp. sgz500959 TaxID=3242472 RepID=UPI0036710445
MYFLATTAIERFWDKKKQILFLQEGCYRFSKRNRDINYKIMPSVFSNKEKIHQCLHEVEQTTEKILEAMVPVFNNLHEVNYGKRYWRIIIGRWLNDYIFAVYDRYYSIVHALEIDPNLESIVLDESCYIVPKDFTETLNYLSDDFYNLQIYSQIFKFIGKNFPSKKLVYQIENEGINHNTIRIENKILRKSDTLIMNMSYFSEMVDLMLINKCHFPIESHWIKEFILPDFNICKQTRQKMKLNIKAENQFEDFIISQIFNNMPVAYIEGYRYIEKKYQEHPVYSTIPRGILSAVSYNADAVFNQWAATCAENGTKLIAVAHSVAGSTYSDFEEHEKKICDRFYAAGLITHKDNNKVKVLPSPKFCARIEFEKLENLSDILFISSNIKRYQGPFSWLITLSPNEYSNNQQIFWETLSPNLKKCVRVRLYARDWGQDCEKRWKSFAPDVILESWEILLAARMQKSKVIVCDNFQTTFTEALLFNKPAILYFDYKKYINFLHPEAVKCFDELHFVGILYDNPASAAQLLNRSYLEIDEWWNDNARQSARKNACKVFTGYLKEGVDQWVKELDCLFDDKKEDSKKISYEKHENIQYENLQEYLNGLSGEKIAILGINKIAQYMAQFISQLCHKKIVGIIDENVENFGKYLSGVNINSFQEIMKENPDLIIIADLPSGRIQELYLKKYIPATVKIINPARDLPEPIFRELLNTVFGEHFGRVTIKNG